ncbi:MAG: tetratricopeptide repeat protein, partial [Gemmatimonadota bacterium]
MEAERLYKEGKLGDAIAALQEELRSNPQDVPRRTLLFELLLFKGEGERARTQLDVIETADPA